MIYGQDVVKRLRRITACVAVTEVVMSAVFALLRSPVVMAHATGNGGKWDKDAAAHAFDGLEWTVFAQVVACLLGIAAGLVGIGACMLTSTRMALAYFAMLLAALAASILTQLLPLVFSYHAFVNGQMVVWGSSVATVFVMLGILVVTVVFYCVCAVNAYKFWRACADRVAVGDVSMLAVLDGYSNLEEYEAPGMFTSKMTAPYSRLR